MKKLLYAIPALLIAAYAWSQPVPSGGLMKVIHDATCTGNGTNGSPLSCAGGGGGLSGLTTNKVPKATSGTTIGDSATSDDGTQIIHTEPTSVALPSSSTTTSLTPLSITRNDTATLGDVTEFDIGQQTAQAKIYTSTTNTGDISALLHMTVRWFNGTDYNNDDFVMGGGGATFAPTSPGGAGELDVLNRSNVAGTTTRIATGDGTGYLFSILSDNAGSTTKLLATDRNTAMEFWTGASGGAKALALDSSQGATFNGTLTSIAGANTFGETEDNMTTASNSSGTLTDASFARTFRGVWWTITGSVTLDGFGFTSGTPTDGQRFAICVLGGGVITMPSEAGGEPTAGRRGNYPGQIIIRSGTCRDFRYDANGLARWKTEGWANTSGIATNNILRTNGGNYEMTSGSITDTASALSWGVPTTITVPSSATGITLNKTASAQTVSSNLITVHEADSWNTTAAARTAYGIEADCADSISSGANTLTSVCGYFTNTSSGANITAYGLYEDSGNIKLNATNGTTLVSGPVTFANNNSSANASTSATAQYSLTAQTGGATALVGTNTGTFNTTSTPLTAYGVEGLSTASRSAGTNVLTSVGVHGSATGGQNNFAFWADGDINMNGNLHDAGPNITTIGSGCGTTASASGGSTAAKISMNGTGIGSSCVITFRTPFLLTPACVATTVGSSVVTYVSSISSTAVTININTTSWTAGQVVNLICIGDN